MKLPQNIAKPSPQSVFFFVSLIGIVLFLLIAPFEHVHIFDWIAMENRAKWETKDYFLHLFHSIHLDTCYGSAGDTVFSPFAYLLYHWLYMASTDPSEAVDSIDQLMSMPYQAVVFLMYSLVGVMLFLFAIDLLHLSRTKKWLLASTIFFSVPFFMGGFERGNLTVHCVAILAIALLLKDSERHCLREAALLLIAFSASLKIYLAAAGFVYLAERRWKEAGRLAIYGIAFFFLPFLFLGGVDGFERYFTTITSYSANFYIDRIEFIHGVLNYFRFDGPSSSAFSAGFLYLLFSLTISTKDKFRRAVFLAAILAFIPNNAFRYALLYFSFPLFVFIKQELEPSWKSYVNAILLGGIFTIPTIFGLLTDFQLAYGISSMTCVEVFIYVPAWLLLTFQTSLEFTDFCRKLRNARREERAHEKDVPL